LLAKVVSVLPLAGPPVPPILVVRERRRFAMQNVEQVREEELQLDDWFEAETHDAAVEMMKAEAVVPFGTAMWPF